MKSFFNLLTFFGLALSLLAAANTHASGLNDALEKQLCQQQIDENDASDMAQTITSDTSALDLDSLVDCIFRQRDLQVQETLAGALQKHANLDVSKFTSFTEIYRGLNAISDPLAAGKASPLAVARLLSHPGFANGVIISTRCGLGNPGILVELPLSIFEYFTAYKPDNSVAKALLDLGVVIPTTQTVVDAHFNCQMQKGIKQSAPTLSLALAFGDIELAQKFFAVFQTTYKSANGSNFWNIEIENLWSSRGNDLLKNYRHDYYDKGQFSAQNNQTFHDYVMQVFAAAKVDINSPDFWATNKDKHSDEGMNNPVILYALEDQALQYRPEILRHLMGYLRLENLNTRGRYLFDDLDLMNRYLEHKWPLSAVVDGDFYSVTWLYGSEKELDENLLSVPSSLQVSDRKDLALRLLNNLIDHPGFDRLYPEFAAIDPKTAFFGGPAGQLADTLYSIYLTSSKFTLDQYCNGGAFSYLVPIANKLAQAKTLNASEAGDLAYFQAGTSCPGH